MEKKIDVKKIVCLSACFVLLLVACLLGYDFNAVKFGEGSGTNAKISSMEAMGEMLDSFHSQLSGYDFSDVQTFAGDSHERKYKSVTFYEESSAYVSLTYGRSFSNATYQRYMQVCIAPNATYYHSNFIISSDAETITKGKDGQEETEETYTNIAMDMELLVAESRVLLRINKARIANNGKTELMFERVIGQWGDFTTDIDVGRAVVSMLTSVNEMNFRILSLMGSYMSSDTNDGFNRKGGSVYTMKDDTFKSFAARLLSIAGGSALLDEKYKGGMSVDLSDDTAPVITLNLTNDYTYDGKDKETGKRETPDISFQFREFDTFTFEAINNTVVEGYDKISAISADRFSELLEE